MKNKIRIHPLFPLPFLLLFFGGKPWEIPLFFCAAALHEFGHILAAKLTGNSFSSIYLSPFGAKLLLENKYCPYRKEIFLFLAGPLANFVSVVIALFLLRLSFTEPLLFFQFSSAVLGFFNLLPIGGLDGNKALLAFLLQFSEEEKALAIADTISFFFTIAILVLGILLYRQTKNFSLLTISLSFILENNNEKKNPSRI